jgi:hypothetical protein
VKTAVEILGERLGKTLARMVQAADKGDRALATSEMRNARRELLEVRRAGGLPDLPASQLGAVEAAWKKTITERVQGAKRGV